jgi:hypothetical protein
VPVAQQHHHPWLTSTDQPIEYSQIEGPFEILLFTFMFGGRDLRYGPSDPGCVATRGFTLEGAQEIIEPPPLRLAVSFLFG